MIKKWYYLLCCIFISQAIMSSIAEISVEAVTSAFTPLANFNFTSIKSPNKINSNPNYYTNIIKFNLSDKTNNFTPLATFNFVPVQSPNNINPPKNSTLIDLINYYVNIQKYDLNIQISSTWQAISEPYGPQYGEYYYNLTTIITNSNTNEVLNTITTQVLSESPSLLFSGVIITIYTDNQIYQTEGQIGGYTYTINISKNSYSVDNVKLYPS